MAGVNKQFRKAKAVKPTASPHNMSLLRLLCCGNYRKSIGESIYFRAERNEYNDKLHESTVPYMSTTLWI